MRLAILMVAVVVTLSACKVNMPNGETWVLERNFGFWEFGPEWKNPWWYKRYQCPFARGQYWCDASGGRI